MSVSTTTNKIAYTLSSGTQTLAVPFYFLANADLRVLLTKAATGGVTLLALTTSYTASGAGTEAGGSITLTGATVFGITPASGDTVTIKRVPAQNQLVDYVNNDAFPASTHERALDKLTMQVQDVQEQVARALRYDETETANGTMALASRKGKVPSFNATTGALEWIDKANQVDAAASAAAAAASAAAAAGGAGQWLERTGNFTAVNDAYYRVTASATVTNPTGVQGKGYIIDVRAGTATIGGTAYAAGRVVRASYNSGAWAYTSDLPDTDPRIKFNLTGGQAQRKLMAMLAGSTAQLRVLSFGDSLEYFKGKFALPDIIASVGIAGQYGNVALILSGGAANGTQDFTICPTGENWTLPSGGTITFSYGSTNPILCDTILIPYLIDAGAGNFKVQTSLAAAAFADEAGFTNVAAAGTRGIGFVTLTKTAGAYRAQVVGLSGTVKFLRPIFRHTAKSGVEWYQMGCPGATLEQMNTVASGMFSTLLTALSPDLITFEMREVSDDPQVAAFPAQLAAMQARFDAVVPNASWMFCGAPPMSDATQDARTVTTNSFLKAHALAYGQYYFDGYAAFGSYARVNALGWGADGVHLADDAQRFLALKAFNESGLTAGIALGRLGNSFNSYPQQSLVSTGEASGRPFLYLGRFAGSLSRWASRILGASANNRGPEFQATNLTYEGAENFATGLEVVPLHAYLGANEAGIAVGGVTPAGYARLQMPFSGNTALANGISWGSGKTLHYNPTVDRLVLTGLGLIAPAIPNYADDAAADTASLASGTLYTTTAGGRVVRKMP